MTDRDAPAKPVFLGQLAHQIDVHFVRRIAGIQMHVDVDIIFSREFEYAMDLAGVIGIEIGCRADHARAALQRLHQQRIGARIVGQAFLRKHADFQIDGPCVIALQSRYRLERTQFDSAVELDMRAHPRGAEFNAALQRLGGAADRHPRR